MSVSNTRSTGDCCGNIIRKENGGHPMERVAHAVVVADENTRSRLEPCVRPRLIGNHIERHPYSLRQNE